MDEEGGPGRLNEAARRDVNEAVGDALGVTPPDPVLDRAPLDAPAHGASGAQIVPLTDGEVQAQQKVEDNGVRFQRVNATDLARWEAERRLNALREQAERRNRDLAARAHPAFRRDGSLMGEFSPMQGDATTPDTVDGIWWLGLPKAQAMWELGLTDEREYARVYRDIELAAYMVENRRRQMRQTGIEPDYVPLVIKRKKRRHNEDLFHGGKITRIRPMRNPDDVPPPRSPRRPAS